VSNFLHTPSFPVPFNYLQGNGSTADIPSLDNCLVGDVDRALRVGDFDLLRRDLGRVKEPKSRLSSNLSSFWRTKNCSWWLANVSSTLGVLENWRRVGEGERDIVLNLVGLSDLRLVWNMLSVKPSSIPESCKYDSTSSLKIKWPVCSFTSQ